MRNTCLSFKVTESTVFCYIIPVWEAKEREESIFLELSMFQIMASKASVAGPPFCYGSMFTSEPGCILLTPGLKQVIGQIGPRGLFLGPSFSDLCYQT